MNPASYCRSKINRGEFNAFKEVVHVRITSVRHTHTRKQRNFKKANRFCVVQRGVRPPVSRLERKNRRRAPACIWMLLRHRQCKQNKNNTRPFKSIADRLARSLVETTPLLISNRNTGAVHAAVALTACLAIGHVVLRCVVCHWFARWLAATICLASEAIARTFAAIKIYLCPFRFVEWHLHALAILALVTWPTHAGTNCHCHCLSFCWRHVLQANIFVAPGWTENAVQYDDITSDVTINCNRWNRFKIGSIVHG